MFSGALDFHEADPEYCTASENSARALHALLQKTLTRIFRGF